MIKKFFLWLFLVLLIVLAIVSYIGYRSFNQETFKNQIVSDIQELTGRTFTIKGSYQLTWDPLPTMTLEDVSLSNIENSANTEMFHADKIQIQIEWASLLKSPIKIKNIIVINPSLLIERLGRSVTNINFPILLAANNTLSSETLLGEPVQQAKIENIHIENGSFDYINQMTKQVFHLTNLTGEIAVGSFSGPFGFEGQGTAHNVPLKMKISIGSHDISKPIDLLIDLQAPESLSNLKVEGKLFPEDPEQYASGQIAFESQKPNTLLKNIGQPLLPNENNKPAIGTLTFNLTPKQTTLSNGVIKLGDAETDPAISFDFSTTHSTKTQELTLNVSSLNLDTWKNTLTETIKQPFITENKQTNFRLNIDKIIWHNQSANALKLAGTASNNQLNIESGSLTAAGPTTITMNGLVGTDPDQWTGLVQLHMTTQDLQAVLPFLNLPQSGLSILWNTSKKAEIDLSAEWSAEHTNITVPKAVLDEVSIMAQYEQTSDKTDNIILEISNIDLNKYTQNKDQQTPAKEWIKKLLDGIEKYSPSTTPTQIEMTLKQASWNNIVFDNVTSNINIQSKTLAFEGVANTTDQEDIILKATLNNIGTKNWQLTEGMWQLNSPNLPKFLNNIGIDTNGKVLNTIKDLSAQGSVSGHKNAWDMAMLAQTQSWTLQTEGQVVDNNLKNTQIHLTHTSLPHLFADLLGYNPLSQLTGQFDGQAHLNQQDNTITLSDVEMATNNQNLFGTIIYNTATNEIQADLQAQTLDATKLLPNMNHFYLNASGFDTNPFQLDLLKTIKGSLNLQADTLQYQTRTYKNFALNMNIANDTLTVDNVTASTENDSKATIHAQGKLEFAKTPVVNLKLATQQFPITTPVAMFEGIGIVGGQLTSEWNLSTTGETPLQMARTLSGNGTIQLNNSSFVGMDLTHADDIITKAQDTNEAQETFEPKLKHAFSNGKTNVQSINGNFTIQDGLWQLNAGSTTTETATGNNLSILWDIPETQIKATIPLTLNRYPDLPGITTIFQKDKRGVMYETDMTVFVKALIAEFERQNIIRQEEIIQQKQLELAQELNKAKESAETAQKQLEDLLNLVNQQLQETPDINAQRGYKMVETTYKNLEKLLQEENLSITQYGYVQEQAQKTFTELQQIQNTLQAKKIQEVKQKASDLMNPAKDFILKLNEMYQKRPSLTLLADLLQNCENQREIMTRAQEQFKKDLTVEQVLTVADIIQTAYNKIAKAYSYAENIYSGRQNTPTVNTITKVFP